LINGRAKDVKEERKRDGGEDEGVHPDVGITRSWRYRTEGDPTFIVSAW
jgi:hypothetical protein